MAAETDAAAAQRRTGAARSGARGAGHRHGRAHRDRARRAGAMGAAADWPATINIVTTRTPRSAQRNASLALGSYFGRATAQGELNLGDKVGPHSWRLGLAARADRERYPVDQRLQFSDTAGQVRSAYRTQTIENARDEAITLTPQSGNGPDPTARNCSSSRCSACRNSSVPATTCAARHKATCRACRLTGWPTATSARLSAFAGRGQPAPGRRHHAVRQRHRQPRPAGAGLTPDRRRLRRTDARVIRPSTRRAPTTC